MFNSNTIADLEERARKLEARNWELDSKIFALDAKLDQLGRELKSATTYTNQEMRQKTIKVSEAVQKILDHLGLKFSFIEPVPERVELQQAPKKGNQ